MLLQHTPNLFQKQSPKDPPPSSSEAPQKHPGVRKLPTEASRSFRPTRPCYRPSSSFRNSGAIITRRHLLRYLECTHQKESTTTTLHAGVISAERKDQSIHPSRHTELSEVASLPPHIAWHPWPMYWLGKETTNLSLFSNSKRLNNEESNYILLFNRTMKISIAKNAKWNKLK